MAEKDVVEKTFISLNDVFADIFNVLVFKGKRVVLENALEDMMPISQYKADGGKMHEQERDTYKLWRGHGINLVLVGIENQTQPDKDMPFRVISYDGASYRSQLLKMEERVVNGEKKEVPVKERYPVITIVLYFGKECWNYPRNLKDCFYPVLPEDEVTEVLKDYIQDYKAHIFDIPRMSMETVRLFQSDFRIVAEHFVNAYTNPDYVPEDITITHVDEFLKLMKVLTGDNRYEEVARSLTESEKEEGVKMCNVLDAREARGREEGRAEGRAEGRTEGGLIMLITLVKDGTITIHAAAEKAKMSEEEFAKLMEQKLYDET
ncbi:MAG: Rpn family recombination-promoting nuclease/putative transposase [Lachnospiraceae bacterium]|nr:Rpn family recombination-promoting nuclease/putative transposase [Lachnospiraceae bacterium]